MHVQFFFYSTTAAICRLVFLPVKGNVGHGAKAMQCVFFQAANFSLYAGCLGPFCTATKRSVNACEWYVGY